MAQEHEKEHAQAYFRDIAEAKEVLCDEGVRRRLPSGHPIPRIEDILQKQGGYKIWSVLDLKDGYHHIPLKVEHRPYTCMSTPRGSFQWKVLVMGIK